MGLYTLDTLQVLIYQPIYLYDFYVLLKKMLLLFVALTNTVPLLHCAQKKKELRPKKLSTNIIASTKKHLKTLAFHSISIIARANLCTIKQHKIFSEN